MSWYYILIAFVVGGVATAFVWKPYIMRTWNYLVRWYRAIETMNPHIHW